jgi:hypothetical protein
MNRPISASNYFSQISARSSGSGSFQASRMLDNNQMQKPKKAEPPPPPEPVEEDKDLEYIIRNKPEKKVVREYFRERVQELDAEAENF